MLSVGLLRFVLLTVLVSMLSEKLLYSQGTQRVPDVTDRKSVANSDPGKDDNLEPNQRVRGQVILSDGTLPGQVVEINASCPTSQRLMAVADSRGKFSFSFEPNRQSDRELTIPGCYLYASLVGYRSKALRLADINTKLGQKLGKVVLEQISTSATGLTSNFDSKASEKQKRAYQKALDKASRQDYKGAIRTLEEIVSSYPAYPSAWLTLGICEQINSDFANAEKSYLEAAGIDPQFAVPLIHAAALETSTGNMQASLTHSQQVIKLYPKSFPDAYALNAMANISFGNTAAAKNMPRTCLFSKTSSYCPSSV